MLDDLGLVPGLLWHFDRFTAQTQVYVRFEHGGVDRRLQPRTVETAAFRIVQEALTNVARHSGEKAAIVRVHLHDHILRVQIEDHGTGFDPNAPRAVGTSSGLSGMRERAELLDGQLHVESRPGGGTCVTAELPIRDLEERRRHAFEPITGG
jgi:signal transduction histidine kinase